MMKSFFKKLAFVMALAMVVSMVAPAGSAFAATTGVAYQTSKEVVTAYEFAKAGDQVDFCFLGAPADWKTTFKWETSDPAVATVDKAGIVTAVAAGTATITITAGADASYKETVVVTVPAAIEFTAAQVDTNNVVLTFTEGTDLSAVTVEDFMVTAIDETFEYTLSANNLSVDKNVVVLNFADGILSDGAVLKIAYKTAEATVVASNGDVVSVGIKYGMDSKKLEGDAYVYTDLDPDYVYLAYALYDANGIDVTANYEEDDFDGFEWSVVNGDDIASIDYDNDKDMDVVCFEEKGAATVKLEVVFIDEDGNETVISAVTPIVAKDRPAIAFTFDNAGLFNPVDEYENDVAAIDSFNDPKGTIWTNSLPGTSIQKGTETWFGAVLTDNRGDKLVTTQLTHGWVVPEEEGVDPYSDANGDTEYGEYGYFVYTSSNENVIEIEENTGFVKAEGVGSATILVSFVEYDENGDELPAKKVGSKRVTVYAESYAATYGFTHDSITITTVGTASSNAVYFQIFDQFGNAMTNWSGWYSDPIGDYLEITAVSDNYEDVDYTIAANPSWPAATGYTPAYAVTFYGSEFEEFVKANKYSTFKFDVKLDKDMNDEFAKVTTKSDRAYVKVYNVTDYFNTLNDFYAGENVKVNRNFKISVSGGSRDVWTDMRSEFGDPNNASTAVKKYSSVTVKLVSSAGLELMTLPADYFIELPTTNGKYVDYKKVTNATPGAIYFKVATPTKEQRNVNISKNGNVSFTFNTVSGSSLALADLGNYTVTLYTVNNNKKLVEWDTKTISVGSSLNKVTYEGFKEDNNYVVPFDYETDEQLVAGFDPKDAVEELCDFKWDGVLLSEVLKAVADEDIADETQGAFYIKGVEGEFTSDYSKYKVSKITFVIKAYDTETFVRGEDFYDYKEVEFVLEKKITIKVD